MYLKSLTQILTEANEIVNAQERADYLRQHLMTRPSLQIVLAAVFNSNITFPDYSDVTYTESQAARGEKGIVDTNLDKVCRRLYIFTEESSLSLQKKKAKLSLMFESLHSEDVALLKEVLSKKLTYRKINSRFMENFFPGALVKKIDR